MIGRAVRTLRASAAALLVGLFGALMLGSCRTGLPVDDERADGEQACCVLGFAECDQRAENGCETWTEGDDHNCGGCGNVCAAGTYCAQGMCEEPSKVVEVVATGTSTCARRAGGEVLCWGTNERGELGGLAAPSSFVPRTVSGINDATSLRGYLGSYCVTRRAGPPLCWGAGREIHEIPPIDHLAVLSPRFDSTCALLTTGEVVCWGANDEGQLGDGSFEDSNVPVAALDLNDVIQVEGTCALSCGGSLWCWSLGPFNTEFEPSYKNTGKPEQLRIDEECGLARCPVVLRRISRTQAVGGAVDVDGRAHVWNPNFKAHLAQAVVSVEDLGASWGFSQCFLDEASQLTCWASLAWTVGGTATGEPAFELERVRSFSAGQNHSCAVSFEGEVSCWGINTWGQLGTGTDESTDFPAFVQVD